MTARRDAQQDVFFSLIKSVLRHSAAYGTFDFLGRASAILLVPLYARVMTPGEYGNLEIFTVTASLLLGILVLGLNSTLVRYHATVETETERRRMFSTGLTTVLLFAGGITIVLCMAIPFVTNPTPARPNIVLLWRLAFVSVFFDAVSALIISLFRARSQPFRYSIGSLVRLVSILILNVILVGFLRRGITGALTGMVLGSAIGAIVTAAMAAGDLRFGIHRKTFLMMLRFGVPLMISGLALFVLNGSDRYFLKIFASAEELGVYSVGYKVGMIMSVLVGAFVVAWPPILFRMIKEPNAEAIISRTITYYVFATGCILVGVGSLRHEVLAVISEAAYGEASRVVVPVLLAYFFFGLYYIFTGGVMIGENTRWVPIVVGISAVVNIGLNRLLIPPSGMMGAAWATLLSFTFLAALMGIVARKYYPIHLETSRLLRLALTATVILVINDRIGHATLVQSFLKSLLVLSFPVLLIMLGFLTPEEKVRLRLIVSRTNRK